MAPLPRGRVDLVASVRAEDQLGTLVEALAECLRRLAAMHPCWLCGDAATVRGELLCGDGSMRLACDEHRDSVEVRGELRNARAVRLARAALEVGGRA